MNTLGDCSTWNQTTSAGHHPRLCTHRTLIQSEMLICRHPKPTLGKQCAPFSSAFCVYLEVRRVNTTMSLWSAQQELSARQPHVSTWDPATLGVLLIQQIPLMSLFWACLFSENAAWTVQKALHKLCWHKHGCAQGGHRAGELTQPVPCVPVTALGTQSRTPSSACTSTQLGEQQGRSKIPIRREEMVQSPWRLAVLVPCTSTTATGLVLRAWTRDQDIS